MLNGLHVIGASWALMFWTEQTASRYGGG